MAVAGFVTDRLPTTRRRGGRRLPSFIVSLLLHALVLVLLLVGIRMRPREPEWLPPPVQMLFEQGGSKQAPSVPNPAPAAPNVPPSPPPAPQPVPMPAAPEPAPPAAPLEAAPTPLPPVPVAPPPATPTAPQQAAPPPAATPVAPAPTPEEALPPSLPAPATPAPEATIPPEAAPVISAPAPEEALPLPPPAPVPAQHPAAPEMESSIRLIPPPPLPLPLPLPLPPAATRPPGPSRPTAPRRPRAPALPSPMAYSLGPAVPAAPFTPHPPGRRTGIDLSFAPVGRGSDRLQPQARSDNDQVGDDWLGLVSAWWHRHANYPPQAGLNGEQGEVTVALTVRHDGKVESVRLEARSGSPWLDMASLAVFRDAMLPPLPPDVTAGTIPLHFTIHYIIIR